MQHTCRALEEERAGAGAGDAMSIESGERNDTLAAISCCDMHLSHEVQIG